MRTAHSLVAIALLLLSQTAAAAFVICVEDGGSKSVVEALTANCCVSDVVAAGSTAPPSPGRVFVEQGSPCGGCEDFPWSAVVLMVGTRVASAESPPATEVDLFADKCGSIVDDLHGRYTVTKRLAIRALPPAFWQTPATAVLLA